MLKLLAVKIAAQAVAPTRTSLQLLKLASDQLFYQEAWIIFFHRWTFINYTFFDVNARNTLKGDYNYPIDLCRPPVSFCFDQTGGIKGREQFFPNFF